MEKFIWSQLQGRENSQCSNVALFASVVSMALVGYWFGGCSPVWRTVRPSLNLILLIFLQVLGELQSQIPESHPLRVYLMTVLGKLPREEHERMARCRRTGASSPNTLPSEKALIKVHTEVRAICSLSPFPLAFPNIMCWGIWCFTESIEKYVIFCQMYFKIHFLQTTALQI